MPKTIHLHVLGADIDSVAGHHTIHAQIEERDHNGELAHTPIPETFGISHDALEVKFGGDVEKWRDWVAKEMAERHRKRRGVHDKVLEWKGKKFEIKSESGSGS